MKLLNRIKEQVNMSGRMTKYIAGLMMVLGLNLDAKAQVTLTPSAQQICTGNAVTLVADPIGYGADTLQFQWLENGVPFGAPNNDTIVVSPTTGIQNYTVFVTDPTSNTYIGSQNVSIVIHPNPIPSLSSVGNCQGDTLQLFATGGNTYQWSGPQGFATTGQQPTIPNAQPQNSGIYTVEVTDANGCESTSQLPVSIGDNPSVGLHTVPVSCYGANDGQGVTTVQGGTSPYTYVWSNGQTTPNTNGLSAGSHQVQVSDVNGCTNTATTVVTQPSELIAYISQQTNIACAGNTNGSATVDAVGGAGLYASVVWSNGAQTQTITGLSAGSYTATVTDINACTAQATVVISAATSQLYGNITAQPSCANSNTGALHASISGGQWPYTYTWSNGSTNSSITGLAAGSYNLVVTDANNCQRQAGQSLQESPAIQISLRDTIVCEDNATVIPMIYTGGTAPYQHRRENPSGQITTSQFINPTQNGIYTAQVTDAFGCIQEATMQVTLQPCDPTNTQESIEPQYTVYPNPVAAGTQLTIEGFSGQADITLTDMTGVSVLDDTIQSGTTIALPHTLQKGIYILTVQQDNARVHTKIIVD